MRKFIFKLHLYLSLVIFPLALVFGITGSLMAFEPEISHLVHSKLCYLKAGSKPLSLAELGEKLGRAFPKDTITQYTLSTSPGLSYEISLQDRTVYINQYTGEILGSVTGPDGWDKFQNFIHQLHLRLAFRDQGDTGKVIISWAAVVLFIILPSGLILWWRQKRITIRKKAKSRLIWFDIHSVVGVTSFIFLMVLVITGLMMGFEQTTTPLLYSLTGSKPSVRPDMTITPPTNGKHISPDSAIVLAAAALPGAAPFNMNAPAPDEPYQVRSRYPEDRTPGGRSVVFLNPYTGEVLFAEGSRTAPGGTRLRNINRAIHTGDILGIPSKIIMCLASLAMVVQVISGLTMWWKRRKKKALPGEQ